LAEGFCGRECYFGVAVLGYAIPETGNRGRNSVNRPQHGTASFDGSRGWTNFQCPMVVCGRRREHITS